MSRASRPERREKREIKIISVVMTLTKGCNQDLREGGQAVVGEVEDGEGLGLVTLRLHPSLPLSLASLYIF